MVHPKVKINDDDDELIIITKLLSSIALPFLAVEEKDRIIKEIYEWRYILSFWLLLSTIWFMPEILNGEYLYILTSPIHHLVTIALYIDYYLTGTIAAGLHHPLIPFSISMASLAGEAARRKKEITISNTLGLNTTEKIKKKTRTQDNEEGYEIPMDRVDEKSDDKLIDQTPILSDDVSSIFLGETGSGKTSGMILAMSQFPYDDETATVVLDFGKDYQQFFKNHTDLETLNIRYKNSDVIWNLYKDIEDKDDFIEISHSVFGEADGKNPFHEPARQMFEAGMKYQYRETDDDSDKLDKLGHQEIQDFFKNQSKEQIRYTLEKYDEFDGQVAQMKGQNDAPIRIYSEIIKQLDKSFRGDLGKNGDFSLKEYIENPDGRVLVFDPQPGKLKRIAPLITFMLNRLIQFAMESDTDVNFILDEVDELPQIDEIGNLTARGRSEGARSMVGVQTVGQLDSVYGKKKSAILGNTPQGVYFSPGDDQTLDYITKEVSEQRTKERSETRSRGDAIHGDSGNESIRYREVDKLPFSKGDLKNMGKGECIVVTRERWVKGKVEYWKEIKDRYI